MTDTSSRGGRSVCAYAAIDALLAAQSTCDLPPSGAAPGGRPEKKPDNEQAPAGDAGVDKLPKEV